MKRLLTNISMYWRYWLLSILQFSFVIFVGWWFDRLIEIIIIAACFFLFRAKFKKQYHALTATKCTIITMIVFFIVGYISTSITLSILLEVLMSFFITTVSYYARDYIDLLQEKQCQKKVSSLKELSFDEINKILLENNFSENDIHAVYDYIHKDRNTLVDSIFMKYSMSKSTLYRLIRKSSKILNSCINK